MPTATTTAARTATANGISIAYEDYGDPAAPAILLVMGLGAQLTLWPMELVEALVARGFRVIRHDNRDIGLSEKMDAAPVPNVKRMIIRSLFGLSNQSPYTLGDMADDAVGLLDALGIERAHIVGASMGGMIAQHIAFSHPGRVLGLTSIMSTTGNRWLPRATREAMAVMLDRPTTNDPETLIAHSKRIARTIGSTQYPHDETRLDTHARANFARNHYPVGVVRQTAAIVADGDRRKRLRGVTAPTLVIHGDADPLVRVQGGVDTAKAISGARLEIIPGMGHDLPLPLIDRLAGLIAGHAHGGTTE
jgi:pimeloyl-ACP methyl ester carboxylesterase